ncbi:hypothetical protein NTH_02398 [Nitratireductor thuwali]|uniref:Uncharacterized protein n=1 Tax=Nitratireductor thuwali TaxID=2267699 RepID=A0ABY5MME3_9HYPH|nr:hypothetical protein NTH_02398 [Nitratireductor thuwali]
MGVSRLAFPFPPDRLSREGDSRKVEPVLRPQLRKTQ